MHEHIPSKKSGFITDPEYRFQVNSEFLKLIIGKKDLTSFFRTIQAVNKRTQDEVMALQESTTHLREFIKRHAKGIITQEVANADLNLAFDKLALKAAPGKVVVKNEEDEFVRQIQKRPEDIYQLSPRKFEILTAELLKDLGWHIELTPQTRDGGKDIIATKTVDGFKLMNIVECKKHSPDNPVGIEIIRSFGFVLHDMKATMGMVATSSYFTKDAKMKAAEYNWKINLRDFDALKEMLNAYGTLELNENTGLWLPS